jgi:hypothetical protein
MVPNTAMQFYGTDSQQLFERNLKYRTNWIYSDKEVTYHFNSDGLRMKKNLTEIDDNYILFSGTSYSMGIGLHEDDRFSNIVSNKLNLDFINCAGPTYSCKIQTINFFNLINSGYKLPKILVIEYAPEIGYTFYNDIKFSSLLYDVIIVLRSFSDNDPFKINFLTTEVSTPTSNTTSSLYPLDSIISRVLIIRDIII